MSFKDVKDGISSRLLTNKTMITLCGKPEPTADRCHTLTCK